MRLAGAHELLDDAGQDEVAVAALQMDVGTGVAAHEAGDLEGYRGALHVLAGDGARERGDHAAGAADGGDALLLGVEVDHDTSVDLGLVEGLGANEAGLLVGGEHALERRVHEGVVVEHRHHERHGDAVVRAEGGAVGGKNAVLDDEVKAIFLEVVLHAGKLVAHHIDVALHHDGRGGLGTGARGLLDDDVIDLVLVDIEVVVFGEGHEVIADALFVARTARNGADLLKIMEELFRLVSRNLVFHAFLLGRWRSSARGAGRREQRTRNLHTSIMTESGACPRREKANGCRASKNGRCYA